MKHYRSILLSLCILCFTCKSTKMNHSNESLLVGEIDSVQLNQQPYNKWFTKNYEAYILKTKYITELKKLPKDFSVSIYLGS